MKRSILGMLTVIAVVLMMSLQAAAQPGGRDRGPGGAGGRDRGQGNAGGRERGPGGAGGNFGIGFGNPVSNPEVQKLLGLSAEQTEQLKKIQDEAREQGRNAVRPPRGEGNNPPSVEELEKFRADFEKRNAERQEKENKVLTAEQQAKLKEVAFQLGGGLGSRWLNEKSLEALNLTADQQAKIKQLVADRDKENREAMGKITDRRNMSQEDREKLRTEGEARGKKFTEQVTAVLTAEQKAKADQLTKDAPALREKLGMTRGGNRGGEGNRGEGNRGGRGGDNYRPGANSWRPGDAAPETKEGETAPATPNRRFPRTEN
ncbi:MAG: hypothetical protein LBH00_03575 [Planctomycetaceae bacterium]|jgi:Spy/CpxP family protein refolding chaperone|nr:hypothetical protein [Planctomycetaceae bacterium]